MFGDLDISSQEGFRSLFFGLFKSKDGGQCISSASKSCSGAADDGSSNLLKPASVFTITTRLCLH